MPTENDIKHVVESLLLDIGVTNKAAFNTISATPAMVKALAAVKNGDPSGFHHALTYPLDAAIDGLLETALPGNHRTQFLFKQFTFVEMHVERLIRRAEGSACCADKSHTILHALVSHLTTGKDIVFDYTQKYTYHLPCRVLATQDEIVTFFDALYHLYYGNEERFIAVHSAIAARLAAPTSDAPTATP